MKTIEKLVAVELEKSEAQVLFDAENLLHQILDKLDTSTENLGDYSRFRDQMRHAHGSLMKANSELNVHSMCDPKY